MLKQRTTTKFSTSAKPQSLWHALAVDLRSIIGFGRDSIRKFWARLPKKPVLTDEPGKVAQLLDRQIRLLVFVDNNKCNSVLAETQSGSFAFGKATLFNVLTDILDELGEDQQQQGVDLLFLALHHIVQTNDLEVHFYE